MIYKCKVFSSAIDDSLEEFEELMSQSYDPNSGIEIIQKETKLTESGQYVIAVHWLDDSQSTEEYDALDSIITKGL